MTCTTGNRVRMWIIYIKLEQENPSEIPMIILYCYLMVAVEKWWMWWLCFILLILLLLFYLEREVILNALSYLAAHTESKAHCDSCWREASYPWWGEHWLGTYRLYDTLWWSLKQWLICFGFCCCWFLMPSLADQWSMGDGVGGGERGGSEVCVCVFVWGRGESEG